jgi:hypothetical protein
VPVGTFRRYAELEGGAIQSVLDGEIGTTEGGARLLQELHDDGVVGTEAMSPMDLTHQLRKILEAGRVDPLLHQVLRRLRYDGLHTGLVCHQWWHAGKSISTPELVRAKVSRLTQCPGCGIWQESRGICLKFAGVLGLRNAGAARALGLLASLPHQRAGRLPPLN